MIGYEVSPSMFHHVTRPSKFRRLIAVLQQLYSSSISSAETVMLAALEQARWQRWNRPIGSAGTGPLAALEQAHWQRWNRPISSAGIALLAALEQLY